MAEQSDNEDSLSESLSESLSIEDKLNFETGVLAWAELVRYFARGVVIKVIEGRDLVEVGKVLAADDTEQLERWLIDKSVARASDDDARDWAAREPDFWCVVTAPWVLVQEYSEQTSVH